MEKAPEYNLDTLILKQEWKGVLSKAEEKNIPLVYLTGSIENWEKIQESLLVLRAANMAAVLQLKRGGLFLEDDEIQYLFSSLKDWGQFFIVNFLEICEEWVPKEFQAAMRNESQIELKWASEWLLATYDQRIHKYPSLPWRSFIRKIITENYEFAVKFLELAAAPATTENVENMHTLVKAYLEAKKKVVCVFPKKWGKPVEPN